MTGVEDRRSDRAAVGGDAVEGGRPLEAAKSKDTGSCLQPRSGKNNSSADTFIFTLLHPF